MHSSVILSLDMFVVSRTLTDDALDEVVDSGGVAAVEGLRDCLGVLHHHLLHGLKFSLCLFHRN
jgi:hypothetical protein